MTQIDSFSDSVITEMEKARQEARLTTQELIRRSGIRRSTYFRKMRGETDFTTSDIDALSRALGVDPFLILRKATAAIDRTGITLNPESMTEEEKKQWTLDHMQEYGFAANTNPDKEREMESDGTI
ncbi:hypothetical protein BPY_19140 [Bifidobacterium psychraerophilum]|jgi:transcriptional regulator with XRE-family HTH domain|uniref:Helix-turn-helix domain-containing protein n=1 Tax=Bifidobacterium psychraerophilum TaxID=218140 RepID=A0A087CFP8_9BIFI|nr:helix-turn-helix transcriptional regulator [Bifidobacterium psychraerophilum]KFI82098.1 helix-turn-helix domain-containing protein [Bifidobacterium psychraerophilum]MCI1660065.1 helix-turn-helix domain-containing protein [Bifidobacterium psychraerophilum]MCI1804939.1 helix-turn-helix domain-containing protein [Bifidobacterium psychraerophilum]MCI2177217.1 helix-turn-helix domain-containing protein [Bifidobacterium psychraerophilum]MCI2183029.1 helix-turn-helix domain-containing protein [Bif